MTVSGHEGFVKLKHAVIAARPECCQLQPVLSKLKMALVLELAAAKYGWRLRDCLTSDLHVTVTLNVGTYLLPAPCIRTTS